MSAKKAANQNKTGIARLVRSGPATWVLGVVVLVGAMGAGWYFVWQHVKGHVLAGDDYRLDPKNMVISAPPPWIHADIKREVIRDASLDKKLSILDDDLTVRIAQAFALHPWVEKVNRVSKRHPASVEVELVYREPIAMVEVSGGLLPVDREGVLLPSDDFSPSSAKRFPRISNIDSEPVGPIGTNWGDGRVVHGAKLAATLGKHWDILRLYRIVASTRLPGGASTVADSFELFTHAGTLILWGHAPGREISGEMPANEKLARLLKYAEENGGTLDPQTGSLRIDLRNGREFLVTPRTAIRSLPEAE